MKVIACLFFCMSFSLPMLAQETARIKHVNYFFTPFSQGYDEVTKDSLLMTVEFSLDNLNGLRGVSVQLGTDSLPGLFSSEYLKVIIRDGRKYLHGSSGLYDIRDGKILYRKTIDKSRCGGAASVLLVEEHQLKGEFLRKRFQCQF